MARILPKDPDLETEDETYHTWHITNWRQLKQREHGPIFHCAGFPWLVTFFSPLDAFLEGHSTDSPQAHPVLPLRKPCRTCVLLPRTRLGEGPGELVRLRPVRPGAVERERSVHLYLARYAMDPLLIREQF